MQHYIVTFTGEIRSKKDVNERRKIDEELVYCYFSLPIERAKELIPLQLLNIDVHEGIIYGISTKIFDEGIFRVVHNLRVKCEVGGWLKDIGATYIHYNDNIKLENSKLGDGKYIYAVGLFTLELSESNPKYKG